MTETATRSDKPAATEQAALLARKQAESPQVFYQRLTKRQDIRRLLSKLAKL